MDYVFIGLYLLCGIASGFCGMKIIESFEKNILNRG